MKKEKMNKTKLNKNNIRMILILIFCVALSTVLIINVIIPFYKSKKDNQETTTAGQKHSQPMPGSSSVLS